MQLFFKKYTFVLFSLFLFNKNCLVNNKAIKNKQIIRFKNDYYSTCDYSNFSNTDLSYECERKCGVLENIAK